jgi:hypothetical protein
VPKSTGNKNKPAISGEQTGKGRITLLIRLFHIQKQNALV